MLLPQVMLRTRALANVRQGAFGATLYGPSSVEVRASDAIISPGLQRQAEVAERTAWRMEQLVACRPHPTCRPVSSTRSVLSPPRGVHSPPPRGLHSPAWQRAG